MIKSLVVASAFAFGCSTVASSIPRVFVGTAFWTSHLTNASFFPYVSAHAGFHNHPVGWRKLSEQQQKDVLHAFKSPSMMLESDMSTTMPETRYIDIMKQLRPDVDVVYFTDNINKLPYITNFSCPITEQHVTYDNASAMWRSYAEHVNSLGTQMASLWTVWNRVAPSDFATQEWMKNDTYWLDSMEVAAAVAHDWPGRMVDFDHSSDAWKQRWAFYQHVRHITSSMNKSVIHYFNVRSNKDWEQTQRMVREIEDADVLPDIWLMGDFGGNYSMVPEAGSDGSPVNFTLTGLAYWMIKRIEGENGSLVLTVKSPDGLVLGKNTTVSTGSVYVVLENKSSFYDFIPVITVSGTVQASVSLDGEEVNADMLSAKGFVLRGENRMYPGDSTVFMINTVGKSHGALQLSVRAHPQSENTQDQVNISFSR